MFSKTVEIDFRPCEVRSGLLDSKESKRPPKWIEFMVWSRAELHEKMMAISQDTSEISRWGSCQYESISNIFYGMFELLKYYTEEQLLSMMGLKISLGKSREMKEVIQIAYSQEKAEFDEMMEDMEEEKEEKCPDTIDGLFDRVLHHGTDLWTIAERLAHIVYPELKIENMERTVVTYMEKNLENARPLYYELSDYSSPTAIYCYLLVKNGWVKDSNNFDGFDT